MSHQNQYSRLLLLPQWQKRRLEKLQSDKWKCTQCGDDRKQLHVHHLCYIYGKQPWEYPDELLETLCLDCHANRHYGPFLLEQFCVRCDKIVNNGNVGGRNGKHEFICETCALQMEALYIPTGPSFVYLMKNSRNGFVKIGFSRNPKFREKTLQSEEPEVDILVALEGTKEIERELHFRFSGLRVRGEWFRLDDVDIEDAKQYIRFHYGRMLKLGVKP